MCRKRVPLLAVGLGIGGRHVLKWAFFLIALSNTGKSVRKGKDFLHGGLFFPAEELMSVLSLIFTGQTSLSQDSEAALLMDYAAAMDSSCPEADPPAAEEAGAKATSDEKLSLGASEIVPDADPQQSVHKAWGLENSSQQWDTNTLLDQTCEEISVSSLSVSETGSMKKSKGMWSLPPLR